MTSNKPVSAHPGKIQTIRPMALIALYSGCAVLLLGYLSFKWVYSHPAQVAIRIERAVQGAGLTGIEVRGGTQETLDGMRAEEISIEPDVEKLTSLNLLGVHVGDVEIDCRADAGSATATAEVRAGGIRGGLPIFVCSAAAELSGLATGVEGGSRQWTVPGKPAVDRLRSSAAAHPFEFLVGEFDLGLSLRDEDKKKSWARRVRLEGLELSGGEDGLRARARISRSADTDGGAIEFTSGEAGEWALRGGIENIRDGNAWMELLPPAWRSLWESISPRGNFSIDIDRLSNAPDGGGFSGSLLSAAWTIRLPVVGLEATGVNGTAGLTDGMISWGEEAGLERPALVLLGQAGTLSGQLRDTGGMLRVELGDQRISGLAAPDLPRAVRDLVEALRPAGRVKGSLDVNISSLPDGVGAWKLALDFGSLKLRGASFVSPGALRLELAGKTGEKGEAATAQGGLDIEDMTVAGLFSLNGRLGLSWGEDGLVLDPSGLAIGLVAAADGAGAGRFTQDRHLKVGNNGGGIEGIVSWVGVELRSALLGALDMGGEAEIEVGTGIVLGKSVLKNARVPAGLLSEQEFRYESGQAEWSVDGDGVHLKGLELGDGEGALRATGTIGFDSRIDLHCVRVGKDEARALMALPPDSKPADWVVAGGKAYFAYRLSGKVGELVRRPFSRDDGVSGQAEPADETGN